MNETGIQVYISDETVPSMTPFEKRQARRERREAKAILHAMKPKPAKPEAILRHTARPGAREILRFFVFAAINRTGN